MQAGGICINYGECIISNSIIQGNIAHAEGGGLHVFATEFVVENCIISENKGGGNDGGGGMFLFVPGDALIKNSIICNNSCNAMGQPERQGGGGIHCRDSQNVNMTNCILWGNTSIYNGDQIYLGANSAMAISYSDIEDGQSGIYGVTFTWGSGNISSDPLFALDGDYHLASDSPCIDVGNPSLDYTGQKDIDDNNRVIDITGKGDGNNDVDMGACEYNSSYPSIAVSQVFFSFVCPTLSGNPNDQTLYLRNGSGDTLSWQIDENIDWLDISPTSGTSTTNTAEIELSVDKTGLSAGDYRATFQIMDNDAVNSPKIIYVYLHVGGTLSVPSLYPTIQSAIDAAINGDTVLVADGTYKGYGNRDIRLYGKEIILKSENGPENCIINSEGQDGEAKGHRAFYMWYSGETNNTIIDGFTMTNGYAGSGITSNAPDDSQLGGAMYIRLSNPIIKNCRIIHNMAYGLLGERGGGGIYCELSDAQFENCLIQDNITHAYGGGIFILNTGESTNYSKISNCNVSKNSALEGGGIFSCDYTLIQDTIICDNTSFTHGGGMSLWANVQKIENCTIAHNTALNQGGGIYSWGGNEEYVLGITNTILWDNSAINGGSEMAIIDGSSKVAVSYSDVKGGQDYIYMDPNVVLTWGDGNIDDDPEFVNSANGDYHLKYTSPCINAGDPSGEYSGRTDIDGNTRVLLDTVDIGIDEFSGIFNETRKTWHSTIQDAIDDASEGDKIILYPGTYSGNGNRDLNPNGKNLIISGMDPVNIEVVDSTIIDCGGATTQKHRAFSFVNGENSSTRICGLKIINGYAPDVTFEGDVCQMGGAFYCENSSPAILNCILEDNEAYMDDLGIGGAVACVNSSAQFVNCSFSQNKASAGGAIFSTYGDISLQGCIIKGNEAYFAAGIYLWVEADAAIDNCTVVANTTYQNYAGGMAIDEDSDPQITNCIIWGNEAYDYDQVLTAGSANPVFSYCDIEDSFDGENWDASLGINGGGNIDQNPQFTADGYHLASNSPCINAGNPEGNYDGRTDIDNQDRVIGYAVDMGADESETGVTGIWNTRSNIKYNTIQSAITASQNGDTMIVYPGTYNETIDYNGKAITLRSADPDDEEIIEATVIVRNGGNYGTINFVNGETSSSVLSGFTITGVGYGVFCSGSSPLISNCIVKDNTYYGLYCYSNSNPSISGCTVKDNVNYGVYCQSSSPTIMDSVIKQNYYGIRCTTSSAVVSNCIIENNDYHGIYLQAGSPLIRNCIIRDNNSCGIMSLPYGTTSFVVKDCIIAENGGPGIQSTNSSGSRTIKNNTIVGNTSQGIYGHSSMTITNNILWDNGDDLYNCSATYSCIEDGDSGTGNISSNPNLTADYHLASNSPCIDVGNNAAVDSGDKDIDGDDRIIDGNNDQTATVDMGADEYNP